jgi:tetratricopeptide (TPR) repeat protein
MEQPRLSAPGECGGIRTGSWTAFRSCIFLIILLSLGAVTFAHAATLNNSNDTGTLANFSEDDLMGDFPDTAGINLTDADSADIAANDTKDDGTPYTEAESEAYDLATKGADCYDAGDFACAWTSFERAHEILPNDTSILDTHALLLADMKKYDEALGKIDAAIAVDPNDPYLWIDKGTIQNNAGRYTESGPSFDRAVKLDPTIDVSLMDRYPLNMVANNGGVILLIAGFALLGVYIYIRERRR